MFPSAPKMPFPQWQLSKRSWWQRCWPQEWTRRPLTNIFSSFVESLEKEVSSLKKSHICKTHPKNAVQLYPCLYPPIPTPHIFLFTKLAKGQEMSIVFWVFLILRSCFSHQHYTSTLCNQCSSSQPPVPCLKANCLQKPSAMWEAPSVSELLRNRLRMQRKYWMHLTGRSSSTRTGRRSRCPSVSCLRQHPAYPLTLCPSVFLYTYCPSDKGESLNLLKSTFFFFEERLTLSVLQSHRKRRPWWSRS